MRHSSIHSQRFDLRSRPRGGLLFGASVACIALWASPLRAADESELMVLTLEQQVVFDDNLYRLPDNYPAPGGSAEDWISTTTAGIALNPSAGLQQFQLAGRYSYTAFKDHDDLNYGAPDLSARWDWQAGRRLSGVINGSYRESAADFDGIGSSNRGKSRFQRYGVTLDAWFHPDWAVGGRFAWQENRYSYTTRPDTGYENRTYGLTATYRPQSGNRIVASATLTDGLHPEAPDQPGSIRTYEQWDYRLSGRWQLSGNTQANGYLGYADRHYALADMYDFDGVVGRLNLEWLPTRATKLVASIRREIGAQEDEVQFSANYAVTDALNVRLDWQLLERLMLQLEAETGQRDFRITDDAALDDALASQLDYDRSFGQFTLYYRFSEPLLVMLGYRYEQRDADSALREYRDNLAFCSVALSW